MKSPTTRVRRRLSKLYLDYVRRCDWGTFLNVRGFLQFFLFTNSYCNLHCAFCTSSCNEPKKVGHWNIPVEHVERFCELFKGLGENGLVRLVGGETTAMPQTKLEEIVETLWNNNRKLSLLTNGYGILSMKPTTINKFNEIVLDDHGINSRHIEKCVRWLKTFYRGELKVRVVRVHYNLNESIKYSQDRGCTKLMQTPILYKSVIYPCCNMGYVADYHQDEKLPSEFKKAGWTIDNDDLLETLKDWRETLPKYTVEACLHKCWQPNCSAGTPYRISLQKNDVISVPLS